MPYNKNTLNTNTSFKKLVTQLILRTAVCSIIALLIYASITAVIVGITVKPIGYEVLHTTDGENFETVYTYIYTGQEGEDWVDENLSKFASGENYFKQDIPGKLSDSTIGTISWFTQIISIIIWFGLIYTLMWGEGNAEADKHDLGDAKFDKLRGLKASAFALTPYAFSYLLLVISKIFGVLNWAVSLFKVFNFNLFAFNNMVITGGVETISPLELIGLVLVLLPLPIFAHFGYRMGNKHIILKERLIYKNTEQE